VAGVSACGGGSGAEAIWLRGGLPRILERAKDRRLLSCDFARRPKARNPGGPRR